MAPASPTSRRRGPLLVLIALLAIAALVATYRLVRGRFDTGEEAARQLAARCAAGTLPSRPMRMIFRLPMR